MAKKNHRRAIQKRHSIVKNQMLEQQRKRQERNSLKQLCRGVKSHLENITLGKPRPTPADVAIDDVEMADEKPAIRGSNFIRALPEGQFVTARRKKVLKQALKRRRKMGV
ncbi:interferon-induced helicase C domain-containing protein 1 isoform X1 [Babesia caballi]|uniref:Interferon-induced helicase C domain-containing protein 1 isoform X1 n=1 Tax=Babesia caballi TaxID=5871 RepID=A0AAV4LPP2_BABCB|nr:interferon-induced helicase C domain-containing protein 1 isoform X1 [Babesia caballi]